MILTEDLEVQQPLIHILESDDLYLQNQADVLWFDVLQKLDWRFLRPLAARYYEALYQFNEDQAQAHREREAQAPHDPRPRESQQEATERLLFERATLRQDAVILHELQPPAEPTMRVNPDTLRPGQPPVRLAGKAPKCFFAMLKAFLGVTLRGRVPEPEVVHEELTSNPSFARTCGFTLPEARLGYRQGDVPSLRKLEQFDQIMTQHGLWSQAALDQVRRNLQAGRIQSESALVHDTTHYPAFSSMQVVEIPDSNQGMASPKKKKRKRKSHPKTTKSCRCKDRQSCRHPWINADDGAGTVAKSTGFHWAHKASTLALPGQEILLDAVAMSDAASHDSQSLRPHLQRLFERHPDLERIVTRVLDDGAADDPTLKKDFKDRWDIELLAPINPRRRQPIRDDLPRGIKHLTAIGTPICQEGYPFDLVGTRHDTEHFLFRAPEDMNATPVCQGCPQKEGCYRGDSGARQVTIAFERLPWLDPKFPQLLSIFRC